MARKVTDVTIVAEGRDQGKIFRLTEMAAVNAEKWAARALLALGKSGVDIPDEVRQHGTAAVVVVGLRAFTGIEFADAEPLMDEMMRCVQAVPDPGNLDVCRSLVDTDIDEVATLAQLRGELMELHTGFTVRAALTILVASASQWAASLLTPISPSP